MVKWSEPRRMVNRHGRLRRVPGAIAVLLLAGLTGCGGDYSPNTYATRAVQQANKVEQGVVAGVRPVDIRADGTTGATAGAAAGSLAGSTIGAGNTAAAFGAIGGGVVGGLLGSAAERAAGDAKGFEYIIRKSNNELLSVAQTDTVPLTIGQKVLVITGSQARVLPDYTINTAEAGTPKPDASAASPATTPSGTAIPAAISSANAANNGPTAPVVPDPLPVQSTSLPPPAEPAASPTMAATTPEPARVDQSVFPSFPALPR